MKKHILSSFLKISSVFKIIFRNIIAWLIWGAFVLAVMTYATSSVLNNGDTITADNWNSTVGMVNNLKLSCKTMIWAKWYFSAYADLWGGLKQYKAVSTVSCESWYELFSCWADRTTSWFIENTGGRALVVTFPDDTDTRDGVICSVNTLTFQHQDFPPSSTANVEAQARCCKALK